MKWLGTDHLFLRSRQCQTTARQGFSQSVTDTPQNATGTATFNLTRPPLRWLLLGYALETCFTTEAFHSRKFPAQKLCRMGRSVDQDVHAAFVEFRAKGNTASVLTVHYCFNS